MCGNCRDNLRAHGWKLRPARQAGTLLEPRPTAAGLERHARRFGPAQVAETASQYGLAVAIERPKAAKRVSGPSLKTRVREHVEAGRSVELIAELEDLSPSRARRLVREVGDA